MGRLFGTDGIRDLAGKGALTPRRVTSLGKVLGQMVVTGRFGPGRNVFLAQDTRPSGEWIESYLAWGLRRQGARAILGHVIPTPGVAWITRQAHTLGIVISASHNPPEYNGIKIFDRRGFKLSPLLEEEIERRVSVRRGPVKARRQGSIGMDPSPTGQQRYLDFVRTRFPGRPFRRWRVAVDSANGATVGMFQRCLSDWGAMVSSVGNSWDGQQINVHCGATDPRALRRLVRRSRSRIGIAFDGDGDRLLLVDERGEILDGDSVIYLLAGDLLRRRKLPKRTVVVTEISNFGLDHSIRALGGRVLRVPVGDRHVVERMRRGGFALGGEASGHLVVPEAGLIGDGMLAATCVLEVMRRTGNPLSRLVRGYEPFPSVSRNVRVNRKLPFAKVPALARALREGTRTLGKDGRLLVRYSGTEPLLRILAEGPDRKALESVVSSVASAAERLR